MPRGVASSKQLAMMARVMAAYCERFAIPADAAERDGLASNILFLFDQGKRDEDALLAGLIKLRST